MQEDIHDLLGKYFNGQASAEETDRIKNWAATSEENAADFRLLEKLWDKTGEQQQHVFDTSQAWLSVQAKLQNGQQRTKSIMMIPRLAVAVAAAIILLLGTWWLFFPSRHFITADTAVTQVKMDDGSTIWLRKGTTIAYANNYGKKDRTLHLAGEAFFEVAPDSSLPFIIDAARSQVRVVGTGFLVNTNNDQVELVVKTGKVQFSNAVSQILLAAGERSLDTGARLDKEINNNPNFNSWQTDSLLFDGAPLRQVVADLRRHYREQVSIRREDSVMLSGIEITARFNNQTLTNILDDLAVSVNVKVTESGNRRYVISKN